MPRILIVDLNNFARYPTVSVGILSALLREEGHQVEVLCPLAFGATGVQREQRPPPWGHLEQRARYWSAITRIPGAAALRRRLTALRSPDQQNAMKAATASLEGRLDEGVDVVLVSTYLLYFDTCRLIAALCHGRGTPCAIGSSYLNQPEIARAWSEAIPTATIVGAEAETTAVALVDELLSGVGSPPIADAWKDGSRAHPHAPRTGRPRPEPVVPDYSDFPWQAYPTRIVPIQTGRGCGWGVCRFCSDVTSTAGRSFRSFGIDAVIREMEEQARRHETQQFVFTDLKLNSDLGVWKGLADRLPGRLPAARWIGAVHAAATGDDGLDRRSLEAARSAGLVRLTTGLESGSQRLNDLMMKGTDIARTSRLLKDARAAGISVRVTLIVGYPGERPEDVDATRGFLQEHGDAIERVTLNRFAWTVGTPMDGILDPGSARTDPIGGTRSLPAPRPSAGHRRAVYRLIDTVHEINRSPLSEAARAFEGVM